ncbi:pro-sigmaK processing inhibitor BofA family protein [Ammonifex thiophilus]|uniref:SigmaK-factor processing regulatory BofA n=1 Tax=Ammonifex thiophilus TaxID=444093 RepID=A0A3D8P841_9THEO|nr:pro-sigmaK processing inhibitor BofA family protein [Ammonifex thiophilus]RDV84599.1 SigmaK-factor processing regulatory BofA [Ammonifex thiophilus]
MEWKAVFFICLGLLGLYLMGSVLLAPLRLVLRLLWAMVVGTCLLGLINLVGELFHFHIALNPLTALAAGLYPVGGVLLLTLLALAGFRA